jgi:branched-chain amino acid transport system substrate-binding protein
MKKRKSLRRAPVRGILIVAALAALVAGCASNASTNSGAGSSSGPVVIGTSIQLSGAVVNAQIESGYQLAVADQNSKGGVVIDGVKRKIQLITLDNRSDTTTMLQQVRSLVLNDHAVALLGSCCQQNIDMESQADALKIPLVMGALPIELLPAGTGWTWDDFQSLTQGASEFYQMAGTVSTNKKMLIVTNNDAQGASTAQLFSQAGKQAGFTTVATKAVPTGTTDFSEVIQAAESGHAQILITSMEPGDCFAMWKQMKALGYSPKLALGLQCAQTPGWASLGALGNGTLVQLDWTPTAGLPYTSEILQKFGKEYPNIDDQGSVALGYHEASILLNAISRAGSTSPAAINAALASTNMVSALGPAKFVDNKGATPTYIGQWENGKVVQVWPAKGSMPIQPLTGLS